MTAHPITPGQHKQYRRFVEDAADKALAETCLEKDGLQQLIERGGELRTQIVTAIRELSSASNQFGSEEIESWHGYPSGYQPRAIADQVARLRQLFPRLGAAQEQIASRRLPCNAEGWFAIPHWGKIGRVYGEAVKNVFSLLRRTRGGWFYNRREDCTGSNRLVQHPHTVAMEAKLRVEQDSHDILVIPMQFGLRHRGRSVRRAHKVMGANEFGLGVFAVGIMLLTHAERLQHDDDLWIDCGGDQYDDPESVGRFSHVPYYGLQGGELRFDAYWSHRAHVNYGTASGFVS